MSPGGRAVSVEGATTRPLCGCASGGGGVAPRNRRSPESSVPRDHPAQPALLLCVRYAGGGSQTRLRTNFLSARLRGETTGGGIGRCLCSARKVATETLTEEGARKAQIVLERFLDLLYRGRINLYVPACLEYLRAITDLVRFVLGSIISIKSTIPFTRPPMSR